MTIDRRDFLRLGAAGLSGLAFEAKQPGCFASAQEPKKTPTQFQVGCTTLPYAGFPLERALKGIQAAGYKHVALYTAHKEDGKSVPVIAPDDSPEKAKGVGQRCRDLGLEPSFMFSGIYPEAKNGLEVLTQRLKQAGAGKIAQVLTFGHTKGGNRAVWVDRLKKLGPIARDQGVLLVVKQHGGETGTGTACAEITKEVADEGVKVNFDAGNVLDYLNVDPIPDLKACADEVRASASRTTGTSPRTRTADRASGRSTTTSCSMRSVDGPAHAAACENIFAPLVPLAQGPEGGGRDGAPRPRVPGDRIKGLHG
jgi:sugar phosphate isomerase/epimerase